MESWPKREYTRIVCSNDIAFGKVKHNQGKQALKRIRQRLGLDVNRLPLPNDIVINTESGQTTGECINSNPKLWERYHMELATFSDRKS